MQHLEDFNGIFTASSKAQSMGLALRKIIVSSLDNITETISGGAKVKLALYSRNGKNNVLCGVQQGSQDTCMLYVHHCNELSSDRFKFSGKGKHAKRLKFSSLDEIVEEDILWLLSQVDKNAPY